jgi:hypothetical protein
VKRMRILGNVALVTIAALAMFGCFEKKSDLPPLPYQKNGATTQNESAAPAIKVAKQAKGVMKFEADVYLDATSSMRGYASKRINTASSFNVFVDLLNKLPQVLLTNFPKVKYHKFADSTKQISMLHYALAEEFYGEKSGVGNSTNLDRVIQRCNSNNLSIIITDLFQTDNQIIRVQRSIIDKYLDKGLELVVVAMKSDFMGDICNVGPYQATIVNRRWDRPFYLLVLGPHDAIQSFKRSLALQMKESEINGFYLTRNIIQNSAAMAEAKISPKGMYRGSQKDSADFFCYRTVKKKDYSWTLAFPFAIDEWVPKNKPGTCFVELDSCVMIPHKGFLSCKKPENVQVDLLKCNWITGSDATKLSDSMVVNLQFDKMMYKHKYDHMMNFNIRYQEDSRFEMPKWVASYNMNSDKLEDGSFTWNLEPFLTGLFNSIYYDSEKANALAHFTLIVEP